MRLLVGQLVFLAQPATGKCLKREINQRQVKAYGGCEHGHAVYADLVLAKEPCDLKAAFDLFDMTCRFGCSSVLLTDLTLVHVLP